MGFLQQTKKEAVFHVNWTKHNRGNRQIPFFNLSGSCHYIKLKINIAKETIFYHHGGLIINGERYIPETLDPISGLSRRYKMPKSSVGRAIQNIADDGGWLERMGDHGRGVKYKIVLTPEKAQEFLDYYSSTLQTKKSREWLRHGINGI